MICCYTMNQGPSWTVTNPERANEMEPAHLRRPLVEKNLPRFLNGFRWQAPVKSNLNWDLNSNQIGGKAQSQLELCPSFFFFVFFVGTLCWPPGLICKINFLNPWVATDKLLCICSEQEKNLCISLTDENDSKDTFFYKKIRIKIFTLLFGFVFWSNM